MTRERSTIQLDGGPLRYYETGRGEPIVFVHGLMVDGEHWRRVVAALATDYRCLVPDLPLGSHRRPMDPGTDLSPPGLADLLVAFIDAMELESATVVGNNTGGAICQLLVDRHPHRVDRLVLTPCDAYERFLPPEYRILQRAARIPGLLSLGAHCLRWPSVQRLAYGPLTRTGIPSHLLDRYTAPVRQDRDIRRDLKRVLQTISSSYTIEAADGFASVDRPVLVVWGPRDPIFPIEDAERLVAAFPDARLVTLDETFCFIPEDRPDRLAAEIRAFCAEP